MTSSSSNPVRERLIAECANWECEKTDEAVGTLKRCGKCHLVSYCGVDCQKAHWKKIHQFYCSHRFLVEPPKPTGKIPVLFQTADGSVHQMAQKEFKERTTVLYSPKAVCKRETEISEATFPCDLTTGKMWEKF